MNNENNNEKFNVLDITEQIFRFEVAVKRLSKEQKPKYSEIQKTMELYFDYLTDFICAPDLDDKEKIYKLICDEVVTLENLINK